MTTYLMDPIGTVNTATQCPGCGSSFTTWVTAQAEHNLFCKTCGACWHDSARVKVGECPGCHFRDVCRAAS